jgi:uncharacterized membrane protein (UPF0127 family)
LNGAARWLDAASMPRVAVDLGRRARVVCSVAKSVAAQARGLQGHPPLEDGQGMLFPFDPPRATAFHMGKVAFPIDLVFAGGGGTIARIVHGAQPGTRERWNHAITSAVIEVPGGFCQRRGIRVGDQVAVLGRRLGTQTYNLLRTLTEASTDAELGKPHDELDDNGFNVYGDDPLSDGYYGREPLHTPPEGAYSRITPPEDRFKGHNLPDEAFPDAMQNGPGAGTWEDVQGYDPKYLPYADPLTTDPEGKGNLDDPDAPGAVRMSAQRAQPGEPSQDYDVDISEFAPAIMQAAFRNGIQWQPVSTSPSEERFVVGPKVIGAWLHALGLPDDQRAIVHDIAKSPEGLEAIADAFILAGQAEGSKVVPVGSESRLVLTRGKRG